jgi:DNA-binding MarR family transcriptional regulator
LSDGKESINKAIVRISKAIPFRLARLNVLLTAQAVRALSKGSDLSLNEWRVFYLVSTMQPILAKDLSEPSAIDPALISRGVNALMRKGLLTATRTETDQRKRLLSLSPEGALLMEKLGPIMAERRARLDAALSAEENKMLDQIIKKLEQQASAKDE